MKYTRTLDLIVASVHFQLKGEFEKAAKSLEQAASSKDVNQVLAALDNASEKAYAKENASLRKPATLADFLKEVASKKAKADSKKKPLKKKKKAKASDESGEESFDDIVTDMTDEEAEAPVVDDLALDDLDFGDDTIELDDSVEELPVAEVEDEGEETDDQTDFDFTDSVEAADGDDEEDEEKEEDDEGDDEDSKKTEEAKAPSSKLAKVSRVSANLRALSRLDTAK